MNTTEYKKKLEQFNSTPKYRRELRMLAGMLNPKPDDKILDFGCGIGTAIESLSQWYPFSKFSGFDPEYYHVKQVDITGINKLYFMHSFAHIENIRDIIQGLPFSVEKVVVVTPNYEWLHENENPEYVADPTVIKHWKQGEIKELFEKAGYNTHVYHMGKPSKSNKENRERLLVVATR